MSRETIEWLKLPCNQQASDLNMCYFSRKCVARKEMADIVRFALLWLGIVPFNVFRLALLSFSVVSIAASETEDLAYRAGNSISQSAIAKDLR